MKIAAAAVASLAYVQCSSAFVGPQFANKALQASKLNLRGDYDGDLGSWVGSASAVVAGLTFASQAAGALVDIPVPPMSPVIEVSNGKRMLESWHFQTINKTATHPNS
jgi:hypothetical protein